MNNKTSLKKKEYFSYTAIIFVCFFSVGLVLVLWWRNLMLEQLNSEIQLLKITSEYFKETNTLPASSIQPAQQKLLSIIFRCRVTPCNFTENALELNSDFILKIQERETSKTRMIHAESIFMLIVILSGYVFIYYAYIRERRIRKQTQNTILFAMHEMRQPIQSLSLLLESISRSEKNQKLRRYLKQGEENLQRLNDRITWMANAIARTLRPRSSLSTTIIGINEFIEQLIAREFKDQNKRIAFLPTTENVSIQTNVETLHYIVKNLLENALKYSTDTVSLRIRNENLHHLRPHTYNALKILIENRIAFEAAAQIRHWGKLFYRNSDHNTQNQSGYGLGLHISNELARTIKAKIDFSTSQTDHKTVLTAALTISKSDK